MLWQRSVLEQPLLQEAYTQLQYAVPTVPSPLAPLFLIVTRKLQSLDTTVADVVRTKY